GCGDRECVPDRVQQPVVGDVPGADVEAVDRRAGDMHGHESERGRPCPALAAHPRGPPRPARPRSRHGTVTARPYLRRQGAGTAEGHAPMSVRQGPWTAVDVPDQSGRIAGVTGANSGLGFEAAEVAARRGANTLLACR